MSVALLLSDADAVAPGGEYLRDALASFHALRDHPAVAHGARLRAAGRAAAAARLMLETKTPDDDLLLFKEELRDFARRGSFDAFFAAHRPLYAALAAAAERAALHEVSPEAVSAYLGVAPAEPRLTLAPLLPAGTFERSPARQAALDGLGWISPPSPAVRAALAEAILRRVLALDLGEGERPGSLEERLKAYEASRAKHPDLRSFYLELEPLASLRLDDAERSAKAGSRPDALASLGDAERLTSKPEVLIRIASLYASLAEAARASRVLASLASSSPEPALLRRMALLRQDLRDYAGAVKLLEPLARASPADASLRADLGIALHLAGRTDEAVSNLEASIALDPSLPAARLSLAAIRAGLPPSP